MLLNQVKYPTDYVNTLNREYRTLSVYFIINVSVSLQFNCYNPKFTIKFLNPTFLLFSKIRCRGTHRANPQLNTLTISRKSRKHLFAKLFLKWGELTPSRKPNTHL